MSVRFPLRASTPLQLAIFGPLAALLLFVAAGDSQAQDRAIPDGEHFTAIELLYRGDYSRAERSFRAQLRTPVRFGQTRWVDSICFYTMLGETFYQRGQYAQALQSYNQACELALAYPDWLRRVEFQQAQNPRPDNNILRRTAPWGKPGRKVTYGVLSETMLVAQGRINNNAQAQQGGVIQQAQFWRVNVVEILRCTALAIRRRNEILGPLGPHDRISKDLASAYSRADLTIPNHWSGAWVQLLLGLSQAGVGETQQALAHLNRAILLDGRYDHTLTGVAFLAQAELALAAGNARAASGLLLEASYAGFAYGDYDVICEALRRGHDAHVALGAEGPYAPLMNAAEWARRDGLQHLVAAFWIDSAESFAHAGDFSRALSDLGKIPTRAREVLAGRLGAERNYAEALAMFQAGKIDQGSPPLAAAIEAARVQSIRNLQVELANVRFDGGEISPRIAVDLYRGLLSDPVAGDWALAPLDTLAHLKTNSEEAFGRWYLSAVGRKDLPLALEVADQAKRRRFWMAQPLGGRLLTLRMLLDGDANQLPQAARLERQGLQARYGNYVAIGNEARGLRREILGDPLVEDGKLATDQINRFRKWEQMLAQQEAMLRPMALSRASTTLVFPPTMTAPEVQQTLQPGQALLVFHQIGNTMHAMVVSAEASHTWRLPNATDLSEAVASALQGMGNYTQSRTLEIEEVRSNEWRDTAAVLGRAIFKESRLDLSKTNELVIVPDGVLWHVPFEALPITLNEKDKPLGEQVAIRYAPTVGLAQGYRAPTRPISATALVMPDGAATDEQILLTAERLQESLPNPVALSTGQVVPSPLLGGCLDMAVSLADLQLIPESPYSLIPLPIERTEKLGVLARWMSLPIEGPERVVLGNLSTAAETGLKTRRRSSREPEPIPGYEVFHTACGLMASGSQTVLLTRWRTGGQTHRELLTEFLREVPEMPAGEAWRRSVALARSQPLDAENEPRLRRADERVEMPNPDHPFLWAGYLLIDTGRQVEEN